VEHWQESLGLADLDVDTTTFPWKRLTKGSNAESVAFATGSAIDEAVST
jgi:hypothetical protein